MSEPTDNQGKGEGGKPGNEGSSRRSGDDRARGRGSGGSGGGGSGGGRRGGGGDGDGGLAEPINIRPDDRGIFATRVVGDTRVTLDRSQADPTPDQPLWAAIRNRTLAIGFNRYREFIDRVLCSDGLEDDEEYGSPSIRSRREDLAERRRTIVGVDSYRLLNVATEAFLVLECGVIPPTRGSQDGLEFRIDEERRRGLTLPDGDEDANDAILSMLTGYLGGGSQAALPYLRRIVTQLYGTAEPEERPPYCDGAVLLRNRLTCPSMIELIWSYWHEESMLCQTLNAIALRFQNKLPKDRAANLLANLELDPLRPVSSLMWGLIQDEYNRLSVPRRAYEYDHQYGISLYGRAVPKLSAADSRRRFIESFHTLLNRTAQFYREDDDTTVVADAFALLNALREVHLVLAEGAHNQFGDLPWTARREMLIMQWILARPEVREFLRGRYMVPYQEAWMGAVDDMRRLQGWGDTSVTHFRELGVYGEQILLSIRYGDWIDLNDQEHARNWARYWRPEIQRYMHAYHAATSVDLSREITDVQIADDRFLAPSVHLRRRLEARGDRQLQVPRSIAARSAKRPALPQRT